MAWGGGGLARTCRGEGCCAVSFGFEAQSSAVAGRSLRAILVIKGSIKEGFGASILERQNLKFCLSGAQIASPAVLTAGTHTQTHTPQV